MSDYARVHDFSVKDGLSTGDPLKVIKGSEVDAEFDALVTHVATKVDEPSSPTEGDVLTYTSGSWAAGSPQVPPGVVAPYGGSSAPTGWLICDGSSVSTVTYANLFSVIGYTYGGAGASFTLPDLEGRVVAGLEAASTRLTSAESGIDGSVLGAVGGAEAHALTAAEMPAHTHTSPWVTGGPVEDGGGSTASIPQSGTGPATGSAGSGNTHTSVQPTIVLNYLIKT